MDLCMFVYACRLDSVGIYMDSYAYGYGPVARSFECVDEGLVFVKDKDKRDLPETFIDPCTHAVNSGCSSIL
jgi:hypothetical protein